MNNTHTITVNVNFDDILNYVYAQSAWYTAHHPEIRTLTADSRPMLLLKMREGYDDLRARVAGYLASDNYNPNIAAGNITMTFTLCNPPALGLDTTLRDTIVAALGQFLLMRFYGEVDPRGMEHGSSVYAIEWRRYKARLMILFARDRLNS